MLYGIRKEKEELRRKGLERRRAIPDTVRASYEERICRLIVESASYKYYDTVLLYSAIGGEPDLSAVAEKALSDGKRVAYPRCRKGVFEMDFRYVGSLSELSPGSYGINEPGEDAKIFDPGPPSCSLCLIPAVAADRSGYRIGYGGGYYDRFLSRFCGTLATVVFSDLLVGAVPHGKYDIRSDMIITEGGIITIDKN